MLKQVAWGSLVVDEGHRLKNKYSRLFLVSLPCPMDSLGPRVPHPASLECSLRQAGCPHTVGNDGFFVRRGNLVDSSGGSGAPPSQTEVGFLPPTNSKGSGPCLRGSLHSEHGDEAIRTCPGHQVFNEGISGACSLVVEKHC